MKAQPGVPDYQAGLARALNNLGVVMSDLDQPKEALKCYTEAAELGRALVKAQPGVPVYQNDLALTLSNLAVCRTTCARPRGAQEVHRGGRVAPRLVQAHPGVPAYRDGLATALNGLGILQRALSQHGKALASYTEAIELYRDLVKAQPDVPAYRLHLCRPLLNGAMLLRQQRRFEEARRLLDQALTTLAGLRQLDPDYPGLTSYRFSAHSERARALVARGKPVATPLPDWDQAVALAPANERAGVRVSRADCLARAGDHDRAAAEATDLARVARAPGGQGLRPGVRLLAQRRGDRP